MNQIQVIPVHAILFIADDCPHCPIMKKFLGDMLTEDTLASLDIVDISVDLKRAEALGVRSVPWLKLNTLVLQGLHTEGEIKYWLEQVTKKNGRQQLFEKLLEAGQLAQVESMLRREPDALTNLLVLFADHERQINVRLGASAVLESLQGSDLLEAAVDEIAAYTLSPQTNTRIDACHVLSFVYHDTSVASLKKTLKDEDKEVREVAAESLQELAENGFL